MQQAALLQARPPPYSAVGGNYLVRGVILPIFVRLVLSVSMGTAASSTTVQARPSAFSAVGGETTLFKRGIDLVRRLAHVQPSAVLPPPTLLLGRMLPFFIRLAARSSTVLPLPTLLLGQMLPVFYTVCYAILYCATPPLHYCWGRYCRFSHG